MLADARPAVPLDGRDWTSRCFGRVYASLLSPALAIFEAVSVDIVVVGIRADAPGARSEVDLDDMAGPLYLYVDRFCGAMAVRGGDEESDKRDRDSDAAGEECLSVALEVKSMTILDPLSDFLRPIVVVERTLAEPGADGGYGAARGLTGKVRFGALEAGAVRRAVGAPKKFSVSCFRSSGMVKDVGAELFGGGDWNEETAG
ncbi:hypothetical protein HKX48_005994 [Thoreauomyces humboldtii]|nr:hypothetical protein HKX48_005994 [Thoreauomyces humboldtii]